MDEVAPVSFNILFQPFVKDLRKCHRQLSGLQTEIGTLNLQKRKQDFYPLNCGVQFSNPLHSYSNVTHYFDPPPGVESDSLIIDLLPPA
jgi:hypothetical protein